MFKIKKIIVAIIAIAISAVAFTVYLTLTKQGEFKPNEAYAFVELPDPEIKGIMSIEETIWRRRSIRSFTEESLSMSDISQLLWAAQGITDPEKRFRAAPSAGATYPLEIYVVVSSNGVTGLAEGLYHYDPLTHRLECILRGDLRLSLAEVALKQSCVVEAPVSIVIVAVYERTTSKYGERGVRYVHMEAGHVGQNLYLQATARGLGMVTVGAFDDDKVQEILQLSREQKPLYIIPVGHPKS
ncbi:MAG: SagB/ThcOx family dehydrogenase [Candidatus Bathyarchaeia archaeon]